MPHCPPLPTPMVVLACNNIDRYCRLFVYLNHHDELVTIMDAKWRRRRLTVN